MMIRLPLGVRGEAALWHGLDPAGCAARWLSAMIALLQPLRNEPSGRGYGANACTGRRGSRLRAAAFGMLNLAGSVDRETPRRTTTSFATNPCGKWCRSATCKVPGEPSLSLVHTTPPSSYTRRGFAGGQLHGVSGRVKLLGMRVETVPDTMVVVHDLG
jgi:hypothetical protein